MLNLIYGPAGSGKTELLFDRIRSTLDGGSRRVVLIVPEQHTVSTEARVARMLRGEAALRVEVTNFTRLSDTVSRKVGGISYTHLTHGARMMILWRAMMSVWGSLKELSSVSEGDEVKLLPGVFSAYRELASCGVSPEALGLAADSLADSGENASLSGKAHDMALISAAAEDAMTRDFPDVTDPVLKLAARAGDSGIFKDTAVFIDSFYSMTAAETAATSELIRCAAEVTATVPMGASDSAGIHLEGVKEYSSSLIGAALRYGGLPRIRCLTGNRRAKSAELAAVAAHLWDYGYTFSPCDLPSDPDTVCLFSVADRYAEAEALCSRIMSLVRGGCRYSDIAVVCGDLSRLRGITDHALRRHGIPAFVSEPSRVTSSPAVRLILSLLSAASSFRREDIISAVKTGLTPLSGETAWAFEAYTDTWNIRGQRMFTSEWTMNPDGYREEFTDRGRRTLELANSGREALLPHIERLADTFADGGRAKVADICAAIVELFDRTGAYLRILERADRLESEGAADDAARERLVWREICTAFDTMAEIIGSAEVTPQSFAALFRHVIADADTGAIPTGVDEVAFASAMGLRTDGIRHVIILGAVDGEFPGVPTEDTYFTDSDRELLAEAGVVLSADTATLSSEELFRFGRALSQASDSLTVFIPRVSGSEACRISEGARRICAVLGRSEGDIPDYFDTAGADAVFDRDSLLDAARRGDKASRQAATRILGESALQTEGDSGEAAVPQELARELFGQSLRLSQSRIDTFVRCPFSYYCKYVLRLSEDRKAEISAPDIGSFVHSVLEEFFAAVKGRSLPIPREEAEAVCDSVIRRYAEAAGEAVGGASGEADGRLSYLFMRLRRQVSVFVEEIMEEMSQSSFEMYASELPIGMADEAHGRAVPPAVVFPLEGGGQVSLHGILDRMDVYRGENGVTYIRVIDYKTGSTRFSYGDVKLGLNIQLLLYLFAAWRSGGTEFSRQVSGEGEILPAGALYMTVSPGEPVSDAPIGEAEARDRFKAKVERSGVLTSEREVLEAMERGLAGRFIPVTLKSDGSYKRSAPLETLEGFGRLYRELGETVSSIAAEMKNGKASPAPLHRLGKDPCKWCKMKPICRRRAE